MELITKQFAFTLFSREFCFKFHLFIPVIIENIAPNKNPRTIKRFIYYFIFCNFIHSKGNKKGAFFVALHAFLIYDVFIWCREIVRGVL